MKTRTKRQIAAMIGGILLLLVFGIVGGMDCDTIPFMRGFFLALLCEAGAWLAFRKAGMARG